MSETLRLFVALDIPDAVRRSLAELVAQFRTRSGGDPRPAATSPIKWANLAGVHVTLKFIGWVPSTQVEPIQRALAAVPAPAPFDLRFAGLGFFPTERRPRVFWAGIEGGAALAKLASSVEEALLPLGIAKETRDFHPHLTLARLADPPRGREIDALRAAVSERASSPAGAEFGAAQIREFRLYQSILKREGAEYTRLSSYPLSGKKP